MYCSLVKVNNSFGVNFLGGGLIVGYVTRLLVFKIMPSPPAPLPSLGEGRNVAIIADIEVV